MEIDLILLLILVATFATAFLSSIFGMLGGLILMGILISFLSVGPAMVLHGLIQATSNGYRAWLNRTDINWKIILTMLVGSFISLAILFFLLFLLLAPRGENEMFELQVKVDDILFVHIDHHL